MKPLGTNDVHYIYNGDPFDIKQLNEFVKRKIGTRCCVTSVPDNFDGRIGCGILREEVEMSETGELPKIIFKVYDDVFFADYEQGRFGIYLGFPDKSKIEELFENSVSSLQL